MRWGSSESESLGPFRNFYSIAASPVLAGDTLLMLCDQAQGSFLVAVNAKNGKQLWRVNRPARLESYSTPILYPDVGEPRAVLVSGDTFGAAACRRPGVNAGETRRGRVSARRGATRTRLWT